MGNLFSGFSKPNPNQTSYSMSSMGNLFSGFNKPTQNPNAGVWNGSEFTNDNMRWNSENVGGGKNKTKKNKMRKQKSFRRKK